MGGIDDRLKMLIPRYIGIADAIRRFYWAARGPTKTTIQQRTFVMDERRSVWGRLLPDDLIDSGPSQWAMRSHFIYE